MKTKLLLFFVGIFSLMMLTSCSDDEDNSPFVGKWRLVSVEYGDTIKDCRSQGAFITFLPNGHINSSNSESTYCYDDRNLYIHYPHQIEYIHNYSISNNTLRLKLIKVYSEDNNNYLVHPIYLGKTRVYRRDI